MVSGHAPIQSRHGGLVANQNLLKHVLYDVCNISSVPHVQNAHDMAKTWSKLVVQLFCTTMINSTLFDCVIAGKEVAERLSTLSSTWCKTTSTLTLIDRLLSSWVDYLCKTLIWWQCSPWHSLLETKAADSLLVIWLNFTQELFGLFGPSDQNRLIVRPAWQSWWMDGTAEVTAEQYTLQM